MALGSGARGYNTEKHWLAKGQAADMNYRDLSRLRLMIPAFRAPEYFKT
jgi:hypothetical protein